jgi:hypothetical protein
METLPSSNSSALSAQMADVGLGGPHLALFFQQVTPSPENGYSDVRAILDHLSDHDVGCVSRSEFSVHVRQTEKCGTRPLSEGPSGR